MKGLILKDIYVLLKQVKFLLLVVVLFAFMPGLSFSAFALVYCAMLPITTIGYDERAKWDKYAATMPYSRKDIVLSKYALGIICLLFATVLVVLGNTGYAVFGDTPITSDTFISILSILCVALAFLSINLPVIFKWGIEKGRLIFIASIALFAGVIAMSAISTDMLSGFEGFLNNSFYLVIPASLALLATSAWISVSVYKKREL